MMKKYVLLITVMTIFLWGITLAYTPSIAEVNQAQTLKNQLTLITSGDNEDKWDYYQQINTLKEQFSSDEKLSYLLNEMWNSLLLPLYNDKETVKAANKQFKQDFLSGYLSGISVVIPDKENCIGRYNMLDLISFANNFPTALTIATRYRESSCGYYLPANGDGPFQIISKDYGTGQITDSIFYQTVQDFIDFSQAKWTQYKSKLWISLTYTWWDRTGLVNHAGLYNGGVISWNIVLPNNPKYVYDGYGDAYSGAIRYGLVPKFLKVLQWELWN